MFELPYRSTISAKSKIVNQIWKFVNRIVFPLTFRSHSIRRSILRTFGAKIGNKVRISSNCIIDFPFNLTIGSNSSIGNYCYLQAIDCIIIGENCCISDKVNILTGTHDLTSLKFELLQKPVLLKDNVWISFGATLLPGVTVGNNAVLGAKSLLTKKIPDYEVFAGNPARNISKRAYKY